MPSRRGGCERVAILYPSFDVFCRRALERNQPLYRWPFTGRATLNVLSQSPAGFVRDVSKPEQFLIASVAGFFQIAVRSPGAPLFFKKHLMMCARHGAILLTGFGSLP
jgi:hypothetical protein